MVICMDAPTRVEPSPAGDERLLLGQYLDYQRATFLDKLVGLDRDQLAMRTPPSSLTLIGLCNHLALVEDSWFQVVLRDDPPQPWWTDVVWDDDPDWEFTTAPTLEPDVVVGRYLDACERSRTTTAALDLDHLATNPRPNGETVSLRWILLHMIEETARHNGHADFLREAIDGTTGD